MKNGGECMGGQTTGESCWLEPAPCLLPAFPIFLSSLKLVSMHLSKPKPSQACHLDNHLMPQSFFYDQLMSHYGGFSKPGKWV